MRSSSPSPSPTSILPARTPLADLHFGSGLLQWAPQRFYFPALRWVLQKGERKGKGADCQEDCQNGRKWRPRGGMPMVRFRGALQNKHALCKSPAACGGKEPPGMCAILLLLGFPSQTGKSCLPQRQPTTGSPREIPPGKTTAADTQAAGDRQGYHWPHARLRYSTQHRPWTRTFYCRSRLNWNM